MSATLTLGAQADTRLGRNVVPTFEAIHLNIDPAKKDYSGSVQVNFQVPKPTSTFRFHARDMKLTKVVLRGPVGINAGTVEVRLQAGERGLITATTPVPLTPGAYTLEIDFTNTFNTQAASLYRFESHGTPYIFTQFEADDARGAFPCWDEPSFKYPFQFTLTVPAGHVAITNTAAEKVTVAGNNKTVVFHRTRPLPSYLLAIAVGPLELVPVGGMSIPGNIVTVKGQSHLTAEAVKATPAIVAALEKYFGRPYPYEKLDQLALPEFWPGAMENAGAVTYADSVLLIDPRAANATQRRNLVTIMAHELAHMWFGDLVTMEWWDDLWLNESFASWMGDKISAELYPELSIHENEVHGADTAMLTDAKLSTRTIRQPVTALANLLQSADELAYQKGQRVLGMFESWMGADAFRRGVLDYMKAHEWSNATAADLWRALGKTAGKDVSTPMSTFLDQGGVPLVSIEPLPGNRLRLSQQRFLNFGVKAPKPLLWQVPVTIKFPDGSTRSVLLTKASETISLGGAPPAWVHPNAGEEGYYRWKVPPQMLLAMTENSAPGLNPREKVGLIANLSALLDSGEIRGDDYLRVLGRFAGDSHPDVIGAILDAFNKVRIAFVTEELEPAYAAYLRSALGPALARFGLTKSAGEQEAVSFLRPRLLYRLADEGRDAKMLEQAESLAKAYIADPASIDAALASVVLRLSAMRGDAKLLESYKQHFETTKIPADRQRYLQSLGEFRDPKLVDEVLDYTLKGALRPQEIFTIPQIVSHGALKNEDRGFEWMTKNYETILKRIPPEYAIYLPTFADGCSMKRLEAAQAFFAKATPKVPGIEKEVAKVADSVTNSVHLREREGAAVAAYLQKRD